MDTSISDVPIITPEHLGSKLTTIVSLVLNEEKEKACLLFEFNSA